MPVRDDKLLRELASVYVEQYGKELQQEQAALARTPGEGISTHRLEARVRKRIAARKRRPYLQVMVSLAACVALILLAPRLLDFDFSQAPESGGAPSASSAAESSIPSEATAPSKEAPVREFAVIPLSAQLPAGFEERGFEQDREKSIYYIGDACLDDVVLTMEESSRPLTTEGLVKISLDGTEAYGTQTQSYSLLTFRSGNVDYVLTCRHDINTLIRLGNGLQRLQE